MSALFGKNKKDKEEVKKKPDIRVEETHTEEAEENKSSGSSTFSGTGSSETYKVLKGFYVSEKSSIAIADNQYAFKVSDKANKSEIKKEVSKLFNVKVKSVRVINMPTKRRDFGRHPGFKSGFKKALVVLHEGYTIGQAKP